MTTVEVDVIVAAYRQCRKCGHWRHVADFDSPVRRPTSKKPSHLCNWCYKTTPPSYLGKPAVRNRAMAITDKGKEYLRGLE